MALPDAALSLAGKEPASPLEQDTAPQVRVQLWDLPLRLFHWSLLTAVGTAVVTGQIGGDWMSVHGIAGVVTVGLIAFRLTWGLIGSTPARFTQFAPTPAKILAYLQGRWRGIGHNPLGALSVFALLGVLAFQSVSGLFSNDDIAFTGPLAGLVTDELSHTLTNWHHQVANILLGLLALHVVAIVFYVRVKKDKLVRPMVTGWKTVPADLPRPRPARPIALIVALSVGAGAAYAASGIWIPQQPAPEPTQKVNANHASQGSTPAW